MGVNSAKCWKDAIVMMKQEEAQTKKAPQPVKAERLDGIDGEPALGMTHCATCGKEITEKEGFDFEDDLGRPRCSLCCGLALGLDQVDESLEQFVVGPKKPKTI